MNISNNSFTETYHFIQTYIEIIGSSQASNLISRALYQALHTNKPIYQQLFIVKSVKSLSVLEYNAVGYILS